MRVFGFGNMKNPVERSKSLLLDQGITLVLSTVLILQVLITVLHPLNATETETTTGKTKTEGFRYSRNFRDGEYYIVSDTNEADRQQRIRTGGMADQNIRDTRRLISQSLYVAAIFLTGTWVRRSFRQIYSGRKALCKSLLAISIGGHAPPLIRYEQ